MTTGNMDLDLPVVGTTVGPTWATKVNTALTTISDHDHSAGNGSLITPAGMNINQDISFNSYAARNLLRTMYTDQASVFADSAVAYAVYSVGGNLYWRTSGGTDVQITDGAGLNFASLGTIGGDYGAPGVNASVLYADSTKIYGFYQDSGISAAVLMGSLKLSNQVSGSNVVTISTTNPTNNYTLTLPAALPASTAILQVSGSGTISYSNTISQAATFSADATFSSDLLLSTAGGSGTSATAPRLLINNGNVGDSFFQGFLGNKADASNPAGVSEALIVSSGPAWARYGSIDQSSYDAMHVMDLIYGRHSFGKSNNVRTHTMYGGLTFENTYSVGSATMTYGLAKSSSTVLSLYNNSDAIINISATSIGIAAAANIDFANSAGSYTAPKVLAKNTGDVTGLGVYRTGANASGIGILATSSQARLYFTSDAGVTPYTLLNVVSATGAITFGSSSFTPAHDIYGSLNFAASGSVAADGIARTGTTQLSLSTSSTERIRIGTTTTTVRNNLLAEGTLSVNGGGATALSGTLSVTGAATFSANPAGKIVSGTYAPSIATSAKGSVGSVYNARYMRVGSIVTVQGYLTWNPDSNGECEFTIDTPLPPTNNWSSNNDISGVVSAELNTAGTLAIQYACVKRPTGSTKNVQISCYNNGSSVVAMTIFYSFSYNVDN